MSETARVATLIANPNHPCLYPELVCAARDSLGASCLHYLADSIACDIPIPIHCDSPMLILTDLLKNQPIDIIVQNSDKRRKKILVADMDSTLILQECINILAEEIGIGKQVAKITASAMNGEMDCETALKKRVSLLKGLPVSTIQSILSNRIDLMPGSRTLVQTMKAHGAYCALISSGFTHFTNAIASRLGMDENRANILEEREERLTGNVILSISSGTAKVEALKKIAHSCGISVREAIAVGDGANDLGMLALAGTGVALHAKPIVIKQSEHCIEHSDLTALLYIQGYHQLDFVV
ncbi:phosphoserine phosphatase SerB [Candidatus Endowatersipora endosymbiont of Watersipora subatra]|uniref:phosphoserine phosphatase SerB n=1 Tax=Candidatus Endowatersipora endosymbiont of Watersipora subatra TaxID=3077946 RepID=UPI00312C8B01